MIIKLTEEKKEQFEIKENHNLDEFADLIPKISLDTDILRIEEDVYTSWSGVSGCCAQTTVDSNAASVFKNWVKQKLYQYRHLSYITYGHGGGTAHCSNYRAPWPDNSRSCRGSITLKGYIEFTKR